MNQAFALSSPALAGGHRRDDRLVAVWLLAVAAMIFAMVVIGGITRLTESGLSITEWKPISGVIPPLDAAAWQQEFDHYKLIPEFQKLRPDMTLAEFKGIFWWEYVHRLWGRLIGIAFALPGLWLLWRGRIRPELRPRLAALFILGGLQGALGWFMVESGLSQRTDVSQYRL
ncbi:MAG TPA: COX15/CtaA family protein, partial [Rhizomicrobium sp.]|nr:COX15/CtaA family protein [Rhizomicrobium sp.]